MALLRNLRGALILLLAISAGCALYSKWTGRDGAPAFSHAVHVIGEKMGCVSCHGDFKRSDEPGMPAPDTCAVCHEEDDAEKPLEQRVSSLFEGERFKAKHAARLGAELIFSHKLHAKDAKTCGECHTDIEHDEGITDAIGVTMARCVDCHAERNVAGECSTCHTEITSDWAPPSHAQQWTLRHGRAVSSCPAQTADSCSLCHTERTCVACHKDQAPASHNSFFVRRGHGLIARMNRQNCATCHAPDSCEQCHLETRPSSHTASWGAPLDRHCVSCHQPLKGEGCSVCHKAAPSHLSAAAKPAWHTPAMNCRQCHGFTQPLPHVDNGDDCNACHM